MEKKYSMRKTVAALFSIVVLLCAKSFVLEAQTNSAEIYRLGHCQDIPIGIDEAGISSKDNGVIQAAALFRSDLLRPFVGARISKIRFAIADPIDTNIRVFVKSVKSGATLASGEIRAVSGWNEVTLSPSLAIDGEAVSVGYEFENKPGVYVVATDYNKDVFDSFFLTLPGKSAMQDYSMTGYGSLAVQAVLEGKAEAFHNRVLLQDGMMPRYTAGGESFLSVRVQNDADEEIGSLQLRCLFANGESIYYSVEKQLPYKQSIDIDVPITVPADGEVSVSVVKVGIHPNTSVSEMQMYTRRIMSANKAPLVLEYFVSRDLANSPTTEKVINAAVQGLSDSVILIAHHRGVTPDIYTIPESETLCGYFGVGARVFSPALMINRRQSVLGPRCAIFEFKNIIDVVATPVPKIDDLIAALNQLLRRTLQSSCADSRIEAAVENNGTNLTVKAKLFAPNGVEAGTKLKAYVLESDIQDLGQAGSEANTYMQNNVLRSASEPVAGADAAPVTFVLPLSGDWNTKNLKVVVFAYVENEHIPDSNILTALAVKSEQFIATSVHSPAFSEDEFPYPVVENGNLKIRGCYISADIFDLTGRQVAMSDLPTGVYFLTLTGIDHRSITYKIMIK